MMPINYGKQFIDDNDINAVVEVLKSDFLTQGPKIAEFEEKLAKYHECKFAVAFSNGTAALHGAYYASGIQSGEEFITSANTFVASANAGVYMNAVPVLCDIDLESYNIDFEFLKSKLSSKTKVVTPVSYAGNPVDIKKLREITGDNITIIHDAAHAIGSKINGANICDFADMAMISFHPVKHIACGEGGAILTNSEELFERLKLFRTHGIIKKPESTEPWYYEMVELGFNYRLTDMQCALGISQLSKLDWSLKRRNEIAVKYDEAFKGFDAIKTPFNSVGENGLHSYHLYPILLKNKDDRLPFYNYMKENNIFVQVHYIPINYMPFYQKNYGYKKGDMPKSEDFYSREISLPMYPSLSDDEQSYVIQTIKRFF